MRLYMITDRRLFGGTPEQASQALADQLAGWALGGQDFLQVREKDLASSDLELLGSRLRETAAAVAGRRGTPPPPVLINAGNTQQIKVACRVADGMHLPGDARTLTARVADARTIWSGERQRDERPPWVSVSCHTISEVEEARAARVSVILFAPIFEKPLWEEASPEAQRLEADLRQGAQAETPSLPRPPARLPGVGLAALRVACQAAGPVPVFALGGVTLANASRCLAAGAAGIAGVRLFAGDGWRHATGCRSS